MPAKTGSFGLLRTIAGVGLVALLVAVVLVSTPRKKAVITLTQDNENNLCLREIPGAQRSAPVFVSCAGFF